MPCRSVLYSSVPTCLARSNIVRPRRESLWSQWRGSIDGSVMGDGTVNNIRATSCSLATGEHCPIANMQSASAHLSQSTEEAFSRFLLELPRRCQIHHNALSVLMRWTSISGGGIERAIELMILEIRILCLALWFRESNLIPASL